MSDKQAYVILGFEAKRIFSEQREFPRYSVEWWADFAKRICDAAKNPVLLCGGVITENKIAVIHDRCSGGFVLERPGDEE